MKKNCVILLLTITLILEFVVLEKIAKADLNDGLLLYYQFNNDANDKSGNLHNGNLIEALFSEDRHNNDNSALLTNGSGGYVEVQHSDTISITQTVSIAVWVKRENLNRTEFIVNKGGDWNFGSPNYSLAFYSHNNNMFFFLFNGGWKGVDGMSDNNWHHYAVVASNNQTDCSLYIDGQKLSVKYTDGSNTIKLTPTTYNLSIGAHLHYPSYTDLHIDDLLIYNRALTDTEIIDIYNGEQPVINTPTPQSPSNDDSGGGCFISTFFNSN